MSGLVVVGAEHRRGFRPLSKQPLHVRQAGAGYHDVRVDEHQDVASGDRRAGVAGGGRPGRPSRWTTRAP